MLTKDEVCGAFDVGFCVELGAGLGEDGVLVAQEFAGVVALVLWVWGVSGRRKDMKRKESFAQQPRH